MTVTISALEGDARGDGRPQVRVIGPVPVVTEGDGRVNVIEDVLDFSEDFTLFEGVFADDQADGGQEDEGEKDCRTTVTVDGEETGDAEEGQEDAEPV